MTSLKRGILVASVLALGTVLPAIASAYDYDDTESLQLYWDGGAGQKGMRECRPGWYVTGIVNYNYGNHDQFQFMQCTKGYEIAPDVGGTSWGSCNIVSMDWVGGKQTKRPLICPADRYAVGLAILDAGRHDQIINKIKCCTMAASPGMDPDSSYLINVAWSSKMGYQTYAPCPDHTIMYGLATEDYGNHDQGVHLAYCGIPEETD